jgi:hypothetical protein
LQEADLRQGKKAVESKKPAKPKPTKKGAATPAKDGEGDPDLKEPKWWGDALDNVDQLDTQISGKIIILLELLDEARKEQEKVLLFSQSLVVLNIRTRARKHALRGNHTSTHARSHARTHANTQVLELIEQILDSDASSNWKLGKDYFRLDGATDTKTRQGWVDRFNDTRNARARLFLISTKAGSLGINLVGANRVVIFDAAWNPSFDAQAIFRAYRFGQEKPVFIYRLVSQGAIEESIYRRQVNKQALANRVVDKEQTKRNYTNDELTQLYDFEPKSAAEDDVQHKIPPDTVLKRLLLTLAPKWISSYHTHESLLEQSDGPQLTPEEQKAAWDNYRREQEQEQLDIEREARLKAELDQKKKQKKIEAEQRAAAAKLNPGPAQSGSRHAIKPLPTVAGTNALASKASVLVFGLVGAMKYNGRVARVVGIVSETGRYKIVLHDGIELLLKRDNLKPVTPEQASCIVLGLPLTETLHLEAGLLSKAYKALALKLHPDHHQGGPDADNAFKELAAANEQLKAFLGI